jgi:hypothetical protein
MSGVMKDGIPNLMIVAIFKIAFLLQELKVNIFDLISANN